MSAPAPRAPSAGIAASGPQHALKALFERQFVLIASLLLNLVFAAGLYFAWSAVSELSKVREELATFENVESRISKRLEVFNTGLQTRLANTEMQYQQVNDGIRDVRTLVGVLKADIESNRARQVLAREFAAPPGV